MNSLQNHLKKVYISLDSLLDTRMGALTVLDTDFAFAVATQSDYFKREQDVFTAPGYGALGKEQYHAFYQLKKQEIIRACIKTKMPQFLSELCARFVLMTTGTPHYTQVEVELNAYPFELNEAEANAIVQTLAYYLKEQYPITMICKSNKELTLEYARQNYCAMIMYDYMAWINANDLAIRSKPLKEVCLFVPELYFGAKLTPEQVAEAAEHGVAPFELMQQVLAPLVLLQYVPIETYCLDLPVTYTKTA